MALVTLDFGVTSQTVLGEEVFICGSIPQLGNWNPYLALKMVTSKNLYPEWKAPKPLRIEPKYIEFKICVIGNEGKTIRWEELTGNRSIMANKSMTITLTEGNLEFRPENAPLEHNIPFIPCRNNTAEILNDLSDQMSETSSENQQFQQEYWLDKKVKRERLGSFRVTNFVNEARKLFWKSKMQFQNQKSSAPKKQLNFSTKFNHIFFKKAQASNNKHHRGSEIIGRISKKQKSIDRTSTIKTIEYSEIQNTQEYTQHFSHQNLRVYYLSLKSSVKEFLNITDKKAIDFIIVDLDGCNKMVEQVLERVDIFIARSVEEMQGFFALCSCHKIVITLLKEKIFQLTTQNGEKKVLYFDPTLSALPEIFQRKTHPFFSRIEKIISAQNTFVLPQHYRVNLLCESDAFQNMKNHKFCLVVSCNRLTDVPQKIINNLLGISSRPNVEVYVITEDSSMEIRQRLVFSEKDKIFLLNQGGEVFSLNRKKNNIFEEFNINREAYFDFLNLFRSKLDFWVKNGLAHICDHHEDHCLEIILPNTSLGHSIREFLEREIAKHNLSHSSMPFQLYHSIDGEQVVLDIRPWITSKSFYCNIITAVNENIAKEPFFFCFDFQRSKRASERLFHLMNKLCNQKNLKFEGFCVEEGGITEDDVMNILGKILVETYNRSIVDTVCKTPNAKFSSAIHHTPS